MNRAVKEVDTTKEMGSVTQLRVGETPLFVQPVELWLENKKPVAKTDPPVESEKPVFKLDWFKNCIIKLEGLPLECKKQDLHELVHTFIYWDNKTKLRAEIQRIKLVSFISLNLMMRLLIS